ncbi:MAG: hypothetical protein V9E94_14580 [Microthrixaceae bacterium]
MSSRTTARLLRIARRSSAGPARSWSAGPARTWSPGRRRSRRRRAAAFALAVVVALGVHRLVTSADAARREWSDVRTVLTLRRALDAGGRVTSGAVVVRRVPSAAVPDDALDALPEGATAAVSLDRGIGPGPVPARGSLLQPHGSCPATRSRRARRPDRRAAACLAVRGDRCRRDRAGLGRSGRSRRHGAGRVGRRHHRRSEGARR